MKLKRQQRGHSSRVHHTGKLAGEEGKVQNKAFKRSFFLGQCCWGSAEITDWKAKFQALCESRVENMGAALCSTNKERYCRKQLKSTSASCRHCEPKGYESKITPYLSQVNRCCSKTEIRQTHAQPLLLLLPPNLLFFLCPGVTSIHHPDREQRTASVASRRS